MPYTVTHMIVPYYKVPRENRSIQENDHFMG